MVNATTLDVDGLAPQEYPDGLYAHAARVEALDGLPDDLAPLIEQYREAGFVSIDGVYDADTVEGLKDAIADLAIRDLPPKTQLQFENLAAGKDLAAMGVDERLDHIRKFMTFMGLEPRLDAAAYEPRLLRVVEALLGAEAEVYQDMALLKPPGIGREKPWHQDHAYFDLPEGTPIVGVWIALDRVTPENGGMHFLPGGHRQGIIPHFNRRDWQICDTEILGREQGVATPLEPGGLVIFDGMVPHGTPHNRTATRRRALQFHYIPRGIARIPTEERLRLFGSEGRDATC